MKELGVITIGQAPRVDVGPILEKHLSNKASIVQIGVLDGMTENEIKKNLYPDDGEYVLTSRLNLGSSALMSREKIAPILQKKIYDLEDRGCENILILCTGQFTELTSNKAFLIEPDQIITKTVAAMVQNRKLGVVLPLQNQIDSLSSKWKAYSLDASYAVASPYQFDRMKLEEAVEELIKQKVDIILLDCMGYTEEMQAIASRHGNTPIILSNALMAKVISEMI